MDSSLTKTGFMVRHGKSFTSGAKARIYTTRNGTTEVVPFPNPLTSFPKPLRRARPFQNDL